MTAIAYLPRWYWILVAGVFGTLVGSFLNVVILRLPPRVEFFWKRNARLVPGLPPAVDAEPLDLVIQHSRCPHCQHRIAPWDNIPVLSWLLLRGRCRYCKAPISIQYPLVEALLGCAGALAVWRLGVTWWAAAVLACVWVLVGAVGIGVHAAPRVRGTQALASRRAGSALSTQSGGGTATSGVGQEGGVRHT